MLLHPSPVHSRPPAFPYLRLCEHSEIARVDHDLSGGTERLPAFRGEDDFSLEKAGVVRQASQEMARDQVVEPSHVPRKFLCRGEG